MWSHLIQAIGKSMDMIRVASSAISAIGYDPAGMRMKIQFVQGHTYDFCGVPSHVFQGLRDAGSKGRYYNDHIRDHYQC
ncbi:KTSC domain-containing protein [Xanthomonas arboricola]|nr:KTSC domain-containing protein [Xanthomonas arboricola]